MDDNIENLKIISSNSHLSNLLNLSGIDWNSRNLEISNNQVGEIINIERDIINKNNTVISERKNELICENNTENICENKNIIDFEIKNEIGDENPYIWTAILASTIVKKASLAAFLKKKRSMGACDIISELNDVLENFENQKYKQDE